MNLGLALLFVETEAHFLDQNLIDVPSQSQDVVHFACVRS